jgi:hypothetical protein
LHQFLDILEPFCGERSGPDAKLHLLGPVHDVLDKVSIDPGEVDAVLFIGGSVDLPRKSGEHQLRNQEVFYGKRKQTDAGISA